MAKKLALSDLQVGKLYLFRHPFNSKKIILQPAELLEIVDLPNGWKAPKVRWVLQGFVGTVMVGDGTEAASPLTESWLKRQMLERADQVTQLQAQNSTLLETLRTVQEQQ